DSLESSIESVPEDLDFIDELPIEPAELQNEKEPLLPELAADSAWEERDPELVQIFLEEGFDIIERAGTSLQRWIGNVDDSYELEALQRDLHTLKGGARMADIAEIGDLAHELESLYEGLCAGNRSEERRVGKESIS